MSPAPREPWWLNFMGGVVDDAQGLRVTLPYFETPVEAKLTEIFAMSKRAERGVADAGLADRLMRINQGTDPAEALGIERQSGRPPSARRLMIAIDSEIASRCAGKASQKTFLGPVAARWAEKDANVKSAHAEYRERAAELVDRWLWWAREQLNVRRPSDIELLQAHAAAIIQCIKWYPPTKIALPRQQKSG